MLTAYINEIGFAADGMPSWTEAKPVLSGLSDWHDSPLEKYKPQALPANERRRATLLCRLAFRAAENAFGDDLSRASELASVFSSSGGDYPIIDNICRTLATEEKAVSPTHFHNSVHNSAAGYWSIGVGAKANSNSISAYDYSFATGLLESVITANCEEEDCLMVCYDTRTSMPLSSKRNISKEFAMAAVISKNVRDESCFKLTLEILDTNNSSEISKPTEALQTLYESNPSAKGLPFAQMLAKGADSFCVLALANGRKLKASVQSIA